MRVIGTAACTISNQLSCCNMLLLLPPALTSSHGMSSGANNLTSVLSSVSESNVKGEASLALQQSVWLLRTAQAFQQQPCRQPPRIQQLA